MGTAAIKKTLAEWQERPITRFALRLNSNLQQHYTGLIAAGLAFYSLLSVFPALAAAVSICGLVFRRSFVSDQLNGFSEFLPPQSFAILSNQAQSLAASDGGVLGLSLAFSIGLALYSATKGVRALISGLNIAFGAKETRGVVQLYATAFAMTFFLMLYFLLALGCIAGVPIVLKLLPLPPVLHHVISFVRWPLLFVFAVAALEATYRVAPASRQGGGWHISVGAVAATALWLVMSSLFSLFVTNFGKYNQTYGSLGAVIILLMWFWLSGYMILLGAEIDATLVKKEEPPAEARAAR